MGFTSKRRRECSGTRRTRGSSPVRTAVTGSAGPAPTCGTTSAPLGRPTRSVLLALSHRHSTSSRTTSAKPPTIPGPDSVHSPGHAPRSAAECSWPGTRAQSPAAASCSQSNRCCWPSCSGDPATTRTRNLPSRASPGPPSTRPSTPADDGAQHGFLDHNAELMIALAEQPYPVGPVGPVGCGFLGIVGQVAAGGKGLLHAPPLDEHVLDGAQGGEKVTDFPAGVAVLAPQADVVGGRSRPGVLDPGDLRLVPAVQQGQRPTRELCFLADLTEAGAESLPGLLGAGRRRR